jgi:serine/threonine protein phosphatase PrpC
MSGRFRTASLTRVGGRERNEDACGHRVGETGGVWVVADGLGGHAGGERASRLAVETLLALLGDTPAISLPVLAGALERTQQVLIAEQREGGLRTGGMRTTVVVLASDGERALWAHVGDSRLYHFREGALVTQTRDHSVPQALANAGEISPEAIRAHEDRDRLLRSLGGEGAVRPSLPEAAVTLVPGDAFLLCTDGFWEPVTEEEMTAALTTAAGPEAWLAGLERLLLERVESDHDNYTALAVFVGPS